MVSCRLADKYQQPSATLIPQEMKAEGPSNLFQSTSSDGITSQKKTILKFIVIKTSNITHAVNHNSSIIICRKNEINSRIPPNTTVYFHVSYKFQSFGTTVMFYI